MEEIYKNYLKIIENKSLSLDVNDYYLWPKTPINNIQSKIQSKVGATDYQTDVSYSRPAMIIRQLEALMRHSFINQDFSILDIACGDGIILHQVKKYFQSASCFGIDCNKDKIETHSFIQKEGVYLFKVLIQQLFLEECQKPFDIIMMLNTYRSWESAEADNPENLREMADIWLSKNARYIILTVTRDQILNFKKLKFNMQLMGKGEGKALMVCISKEPMPQLSLAERINAWAKIKLMDIRR